MRKRILESMRPIPRRLQDQRGITGLETAIVLIAFVVVSSVFAFAALSTGLFSSDKSRETIAAGLSEATGTLEMRGAIIAKSLAVTNESLIAAGSALAVLTGSMTKTPVLSDSQTVRKQPGAVVLTEVASSPGANQYTISDSTGLVTIGSGTRTATGDSIEAGYTAQIVDQISIQVANAAGGGAVDLTPGNMLITYADANQFVNVATGDVTITGMGNTDTDNLVEAGETYEIKISNLESKLTPDLKKDTLFIMAIKPAQGAVMHVERRTPVALEKVNNLG